ncbi:hypothetical protein GCM10009549_04750 [Streptomyces thermoalcalitolerans]|uniref:VWFA domain-containing protein n=1 Tax=Streptomyces thermoalcalitolerans TaxID=65605 RepID=A0ABN1NE28_9ACTN
MPKPARPTDQPAPEASPEAPSKASTEASAEASPEASTEAPSETSTEVSATEEAPAETPATEETSPVAEEAAPATEETAPQTAPDAPPAPEPEPQPDTTAEPAAETEPVTEAKPATETESATEEGKPAETEPQPAAPEPAAAATDDKDVPQEPSAPAHEARTDSAEENAPAEGEAETPEPAPLPQETAEAAAPAQAPQETPEETPEAADPAPASQDSRETAEAADPTPAPQESQETPEAADPTPSAKAAAAPATSLARVKSRAPGLTTAYKAAGAVLKKYGLTGTRAKVYLVLDRSASMRPYYKDGSAQALGEQTLALAAHLDPEASVHVTFFSTDVDGTGELTLTDHENKIDELHGSLGRMGRTSYHVAVEAVLDQHRKSVDDPAGPALVIFQTDGAPDAKTPATRALTEAAEKHPSVFFSFVAFGEHDNKAFDYLRKLKTDTSSFFHAGPAPRELTDKEFYEGVLANWRP